MPACAPPSASRPARRADPSRLPVRLPDLLTALGAALLVTSDVSLAELASALDISIPAVRENLDRAARRLEEVGFSLTDDGGRVRSPRCATSTRSVRPAGRAG
jgi:hypothetical protein